MVKHHVSESQMSLWTPEETLAPELSIVPETVNTIEPLPASTNIAQRARSIGQLMSLFNEESRAKGMERALESPQRRIEIEARYGESAATVAKAAVKNSEDKEIQKRRLFAEATGMYALIAAKWNVEDVKDETALLYLKMRHEYGPGNATAAKRNKLAHTVQQSADVITGKKQPRRRKSA